VSRIRRLLRRRITVVALTALCALVLAVPASARTALEPGQSGPGSQGMSLRLADGSSSSIASRQTAAPSNVTRVSSHESYHKAMTANDAASPRLADGSAPAIANRGGAGLSLSLADKSNPSITARHATAGNVSSDDSGVNVLAFVLSLTGAAVLAAGAATVVTARTQRPHHTA
jgi:hypothetical protein